MDKIQVQLLQQGWTYRSIFLPEKYHRDNQTEEKSVMLCLVDESIEEKKDKKDEC